MFLYPCANVASNKPRLQEQFNDVLKNIFQYRQKFQFSQKKVLHALSIFCYEYFPISKACFFFFLIKTGQRQLNENTSTLFPHKFEINVERCSIRHDTPSRKSRKINGQLPISLFRREAPLISACKVKPQNHDQRPTIISVVDGAQTDLDKSFHITEFRARFTMYNYNIIILFIELKETSTMKIRNKKNVSLFHHIQPAQKFFFTRRISV